MGYLGLRLRFWDFPLDYRCSSRSHMRRSMVFHTKLFKATFTSFYINTEISRQDYYVIRLLVNDIIYILFDRPLSSCRRLSIKRWGKMDSYLKKMVYLAYIATYIYEKGQWKERRGRVNWTHMPKKVYLRYIAKYISEIGRRRRNGPRKWPVKHGARWVGHRKWKKKN